MQLLGSRNDTVKSVLGMGENISRVCTHQFLHAIFHMELCAGVPNAQSGSGCDCYFMLLYAICTMMGWVLLEILFYFINATMMGLKNSKTKKATTYWMSQVSNPTN